MSKTNESNCPECGAPFTETKLIPDLCKDPRGWFQVVDADCGGNLSKQEVLYTMSHRVVSQPRVPRRGRQLHFETCSLRNSCDAYLNSGTRP